MNKILNYLGVARKADYLIIGSDKLKTYLKKLYLVVVNQNISKNIQKVCCDLKKRYDNLQIIVINDDFSKIIGIDNCKIVGIKNLGISNAILQCKEDYIFLEMN